MCHRCADPTATHVTIVARRHFLTLAGAAMAGLAMSRDGFAEGAQGAAKAGQTCCLPTPR